MEENKEIEGESSLITQSDIKPMEDSATDEPSHITPSISHPIIELYEYP